MVWQICKVEKKVWQMGQFPRSYPGAGKISSLILAVDLPAVSKVIEIISFFINWSLKYLNCCELAGMRDSYESIDLVVRKHILEYCKQLELRSMEYLSWYCKQLESKSKSQ
jgi:hypothetical protein